MSHLSKTKFLFLTLFSLGCTPVGAVERKELARQTVIIAEQGFELEKKEKELEQSVSRLAQKEREFTKLKGDLEKAWKSREASFSDELIKRKESHDEKINELEEQHQASLRRMKLDNEAVFENYKTSIQHDHSAALQGMENKLKSTEKKFSNLNSAYRKLESEIDNAVTRIQSFGKSYSDEMRAIEINSDIGLDINSPEEERARAILRMAISLKELRIAYRDLGRELKQHLEISGISSAKEISN